VSNNSIIFLNKDEANSSSPKSYILKLTYLDLDVSKTNQSEAAIHATCKTLVGHQSADISGTLPQSKDMTGCWVMML